MPRPILTVGSAIALGATLWVCLAAQGLAVQNPTTPTAPATGLIIGQVVDAGSGQPVDGAYVRLDSLNTRGPEVIADAQGRFLFRNVSEGQYSISAQQDGFIRGSYGRNWPSDKSRPLDVDDNERITNVTIRLWKYASIGGRVVDETGEPIVGATVRALLKTIVGGRTTLTHDTFECSGACLRQQTDDRGVFRFAQLIPGEYVVVVPSVTSAGPTSFQRLTAAAKAGDAGSAAYFESSVMGLEWLGGGGVVTPTRAGIRTRDDRIAIGDIDRGAPLAAVAEDGQVFIYPTQFYPSVTRLADAAMIPVASGEERSDINFSLKPVKTARVSGTLTGPDGPAADFVLRLVPADEDLLATDPEVAITASDADGTFTFVGVTPGNYFIRMQRVPRPRSRLAPAGPVVSSGSGGGGGIAVIGGDDSALPAGRVQWAESQVSVGNADVHSVSVVVREGVRISGRVELIGASPKPVQIPPTLYVERANGRRSVNLGLTLVRVDAQLQFESQGSIPGKYLLQVPFAPAGWFFKSAILQGRDVSEVPVELVGGDVTGIVVTFTDKPASVLSGTVTTSAGAPDTGAVVLVFPAEPARWVDVGFTPRRFALTSADRHGGFSVTNLPPGDYLIAGIQNAAEVLWRAPAVLASLSPVATRVTLRESQSVTVTIRSSQVPKR